MKHTIIVGSNLPEAISKELVIRTQELTHRLPEGDEAAVITLVPFEIDRIVAGRIKFAEELDIQAAFENAERRKTILNDAITFIKEVKQQTGTPAMFKTKTSMSWSQFNKVLANYELFGFIKYSDNRKVITFTLEEKDIKENIIEGINADMEALLEKVKTVKHQFDKKEVSFLTALERKLKTKLNVNPN